MPQCAIYVRGQQYQTQREECHVRIYLLGSVYFRIQDLKYQQTGAAERGAQGPAVRNCLVKKKRENKLASETQSGF